MITNLPRLGPKRNRNGFAEIVKLKLKKKDSFSPEIPQNPIALTSIIKIPKHISSLNLLYLKFKHSIGHMICILQQIVK